jgi:hypothetical protein
LTSSYVEKWYKTAVRPSLTPLLFGPRRRAPYQIVLAQMKTTGTKLRIPKDIRNAIMQALASIHTGTSQPYYHNHKPEITTALNSLRPIVVWAGTKNSLFFCFPTKESV